MRYKPKQAWCKNYRKTGKKVQSLSILAASSARFKQTSNHPVIWLHFRYSLIKQRGKKDYCFHVSPVRSRTETVLKHVFTIQIQDLKHTSKCPILSDSHTLKEGIFQLLGRISDTMKPAETFFSVSQIPTWSPRSLVLTLHILSEQNFTLSHFYYSIYFNFPFFIYHSLIYDKN